ncbi:MAG: heavy metal translocating P-type ATPase [Catonella sp.]|uniref:heavy metal translocating P-type ATPase n=1 Tax=Catonella sp. TaxID=2382125 RepID=UPI003F9F8FCC
MKFKILSESDSRIRIQILQKSMSFEQADTLVYYIRHIRGVTFTRVADRTCTATIKFNGDKWNIVAALQKFNYERFEAPEEFIKNSSRALNAKYQDKLVRMIAVRFLRRTFMPSPLRMGFIMFKSFKYVRAGLKCLFRGKIEVALLDGAAVGVSVLRRDFRTAGSVMFLLKIGELLEEWTEKKTTADLAGVLSLNISKVWLKKDNTEVLVNYSEVKEDDEVLVHLSGVVPFDGVVTEGEAMINQASMTGESEAVRKEVGSTVFAGTVIEEGEITFKVKKTGGNSKFEKIVKMIEETEKLKSGAEGKALRLADKLVPYTLAGTGLVYLLTRNVTKALAVLMVDFSCALKLAMPVSVLSAIREASENGITVKGGKFLEAVADAETIVFDKTGTLTKAEPVVTSVISFEDRNEDELLRIAACLEEHFPHSMANAVVEAARKKGLKHDEMHSKVNYIVAHGISSSISDKKVIIGSYHFVFEDEGVIVPKGLEDRFANIPEDSSHLYMAIEGKLSAVICISDPVREEAREVISKLRVLGIKKVVMMTGDNKRTARAVAAQVGVDKYYAEVLPEDKARFVEEEKAKGRKVIMVGDGINDSPALSAADCGIAISDGAELAREIADITIVADNLNELVKLKMLSNSLMKRINSNYRSIVGINGGLIGLGVFGVIRPTTSALVHNLSTLAIGVHSTTNLMDFK